MDKDVGVAVVEVSFFAPAEQQWLFIEEAIEGAESEDELGAVAAGPLEHLLGKHGDDYVETVESLALSNDKFATAITGVWQYMMSDALWERVQALQRRIEKAH